MLVKSVLEAALLSAFQKENNTAAQAASDIAAAIDTYVKTGTVASTGTSVTGGAVTTTGTIS